MSQQHASYRSRGGSLTSVSQWRGVTLVLACVLFVYYLLPVVALWTSQSPSALVDGITSEFVLTAATNSIVAASLSTLLAVIFGVPLAYWLSRTKFRGQNVVLAIVMLPLVLPPVVSGMLLLKVVGPAGLGRVVTVPLTRSLFGVILAQTYVASPFLVVTAKTAFDGVDRELEAAARSLGEDGLGAIRRITLPLAKPGILAGVTLTFARAIGEFGATLMMAYYPRTLPVQIWVSYLSTGLDAALPVAVVLIGIAVSAIFIVHALGTNPWE
ncbi:ABC transporter permease subunit [Haloferax mediterranei ATCC 33500]|uniref:ABC transporter permease subunit n=1 Tax=Haloferax mediterranei (strain ATCC 33500 / DSM 1411 / JCM 8866 / NBRC 14739 / NCIMB 2177 / R-4) TaxID=523841 RepID=I3R6P6_HALMT|nr:ABC transporter permease [Haloferax mediterranei]AFK19906.2 sulfate transport system permease protein [Haloferax mediterranei ATCC 33500]AHZ23285.1 sulfate ABC transporter permease [Haloferax mediterranei ATCC 33500]ELZ99450.1 sulfate transport system permease [Haloferax mediterranei ATCC 33500]MDX5987345.1 ABC transporter permease [Haloferax mediterranei ATCC 33500]QCQ73857.1 ABC transporter permease subunit [Haloferax mediterranei ATCC 33500]